ncbi:putative phosphoribosyltransferase [Collimonas arenae]|uniref:Putative phosphoribosyltransferase n=1 Tax=Collimonas arenae TaxID=279058 RepID=A0A127QHJ2_9BURK|nr:phosphoribosyltransferase family protein [Collimonas arenae]AMO99640.1 putative phosphoribosyltransferase [Collimonas arenae]AMP09538.1 putative phosphoribosyltransferase [Collimonas arenae]
MDTLRTFANRIEAAEILAFHLLEYKGRNPLILAIPRGGVPMGKVIAELLDGELDIVLVRKLSAPFNPECAIGAIDETGWVYLDPFSDELAGTDAFLEQEKSRQLNVLRQRRKLYTPHKHTIAPGGRIAIIVDDGLATGATMIAALHTVRARRPAELVCAVPVAAPESLKQVKPLADKVLCLYAPSGFFAVGQFYRDFRQVEDEEVIRIFSRRHNGGNAGTQA